MLSSDDRRRRRTTTYRIGSPGTFGSGELKIQIGIKTKCRNVEKSVFQTVVAKKKSKHVAKTKSPRNLDEYGYFRL